MTPLDATKYILEYCLDLNMSCVSCVYMYNLYRDTCMDIGIYATMRLCHVFATVRQVIYNHLLIINNSFENRLMV